MNLFLKLAAVAALAIALIGGAVLVVGGRRESAPPQIATPSPIPASPAVPSSAATAVDEALRSRWTADADPIPALGVAGPRIGLMVHETGSSAWIIPSDSRSRAATSTLRATGPSELTRFS